MIQDYLKKLVDLLVEYSPRVIYALVLLIVGLFIIGLFTKGIKKIMAKRDVDLTLQKFLGDLVNWTLKVLLIVAVISKLGVETTSFAAIIAAAGLAVGLALQGSLSNFAGGALLMFFRPFKVGDLIEAQGELGVVKEIQIFTTHIITPGNKLAIIPNGALSNGNIKNYSAEGVIRVDLTIGVSYDSNITQTKQVLMEVLTSHPKVQKKPAPTVNVSELAESSVNFVVRPFATVEDYWDVYFDVTEACKLALDKAGIEIPFPHQVEIHKKA
jgi:small conductance mechanosensitive channel